MKEGTGNIIFLGGDGNDHEVRIETLIIIMSMAILRTSIMVAIDKDRGMFDKHVDC